MGISISCVIQKGGAGKSTLATAASTFFALKSHKTLLIDIDPQANATEALLGDDEMPSLKDVLMDGKSLNEVIVKTKFPSLENLDILPANISLAKLEKFFIVEPDGVYFLRDLITDNGLRERYDYIIFDCPPSLGMITTNVLVASDFVVIPLESRKFSAKGISDLQETILQVNKRSNPNVSILGAFINRYISGRKIYEHNAQDIKSYFGDLLFETIVRENAQIEEAVLNQTPIFLYSPKSNGAQDLAALCNEILDRLKTKTLMPLSTGV